MFKNKGPLGKEDTPFVACGGSKMRLTRGMKVPHLCSVLEKEELYHHGKPGRPMIISFV